MKGKEKREEREGNKQVRNERERRKREEREGNKQVRNERERKKRGKGLNK